MQDLRINPLDNRHLICTHLSTMALCTYIADAARRIIQGVMPEDPRYAVAASHGAQERARVCACAYMYARTRAISDVLGHFIHAVVQYPELRPQPWDGHR